MNEQFIGKLLESSIFAIMWLVIYIAFWDSPLQWFVATFFVGIVLLIVRGIE